MSTAWRSVTEPLIHCLFPPLCCGCETPLFGSHPAILCGACHATLTFHDTRSCHTCSAAAGQHSTLGKDCERCRRLDLRFTRAAGVFTYASPARELIHAFKFYQQRALAKPLAAMMLKRLAAVNFPAAFDCVIPVPLHPRRIRERGYNQSHLLAREIAGAKDWTLERKRLTRIRYTLAQSLLSHTERATNPLGAFALNGTMPGANVLLIDDVLTTGATVSECARVLREGGARRVYVLVFSR